MHWLRADGAGGLQTLLPPSKDVKIPWSFNGAGDRLAFYQRGASPEGSVSFDLWTVAVQRNGDTLSASKPEPFLVTDSFETYPMFSPDGHWLAYTSLESGTYEVYVRAFPDNGRKWLVSSGGGADPHWSGNQLFYRRRGGQQHVMVVDFTISGATFKPMEPRLWSKTALADTGVLPNFDVSRDGKLAALLPAPQTGEPQDDRHVTMVMNFLDDVRRRAAASKE
jgi:serine/threonine-protein kinase